MKIRLILMGCTLGAAASLATTHALSQNEGGSTPQLSPEQVQQMQLMQEMMDKWLATTKPGPEHEFLNLAIGEWDTTSRVWWGGPGSDPVVTHGTANRTWVLGGRFVLDEFKTKHALPSATGGVEMIDMEGIGVMGFDRARNLYTASWADSMNTQIMTMRGTRVPGSDTINFYGEMDEVMLNMYGRTVKFVKRFPDKDTEIFEIIDLAAGDDYKVVEITYKRR